MAAPEKKTPVQAKKKEAEKPVQKTVKGMPEAAKTAKKPVVEERKLKLAPTPKPAEKPLDKPADRLVEKPAQKSADKQAERPVEKLVEKPVEKQVQKPAEKPSAAEKVPEKPAKAEKPLEEVEKPAKPAAKEVPAKKTEEGKKPVAEEKKAVKEKKKKPAVRKVKPVEKIQFLGEKKPSKEGLELISQKKEKPRFTRQEFNKLPRLETVWRKSRGIDSKKHEGCKGKGWTPNQGYKNPEEIRGIHSTGYFPINVCNLKDLDKIVPGKQAAVIAASIGRKKRNEIIASANDKKIVILNPRRKER